MATVPLDTSAADLPAAQLAAVRELLAEILPHNRFYAQKFGHLNPQDLDTPDAFGQLPLTTKAELVSDQTENPPYGSNLTFPPDRYTRFHQTSGTSTGRPLFWLDTAGSWDWLLDCWAQHLALVGLKPTDRLFFPFSFGPFLGFWTAFEGAARAGYRVMPGGGLSTAARLKFLIEHACTVLFATPTYALHLAETAAHDGLDLSRAAVRALVLAGEPGGNIPATRARLETAWGARVFDTAINPPDEAKKNEYFVFG
ncbi:MAG: phenylacetate--CoA ligase family protein, partial [Gemmataceae bacterium]|nr:phenylacetate--CoA ligase family protein [Gemmataceae bacterium]